MSVKRKVEVFSAGCPVCTEAIKQVENIACPSCDVQVHDMNDPSVAGRAVNFGIASLPAIVIDGKLADCCKYRQLNEADLKKAGIGQPLN